MSRFNYTSALGDNLSPFVPKKEYIATEALIGAGIGVASLAGSLYSQYQDIKSQADTNEMNYKIHQEDLEAQREMWKNSQMENRFLVDQAYERNLPKNVVKNLREAGINPAFALNSGAYSVQGVQAGSAPSPSSVPSGVPMQAAKYIDLGAGISRAGEIAQMYYDAQRQNERADYALASDITVNHMNARSNYINAIARAHEVGVSDKRLQSDIENSDRLYWLEQDKWAKDKEYKDAELKLREASNDIEQYRAQTERLSVESGIALNKAAIGKIAQEIQESKDRILEMKKEGYSKEEINAWIASKEKALAKMAQIEAHRSDRQSKNVPGQIWDDFASALLNPLKGLISLGGKF